MIKINLLKINIKVIRMCSSAKRFQKFMNLVNVMYVNFYSDHHQFVKAGNVFNEKEYFSKFKISHTYQVMTDKSNKDGGRQPGARIEQVVSHGCVANE